jgi:glycosyltransferase involved in cell wall biosynthesis
MKILHLQTELNLACGITRTISQIIKNSSKEFEHHLIAIGGNGLSRFERISFNPKILNLNRFSLIGSLKIYFFLLNYCKEHSIQIIHSHHRYFDTLVWLLKPVLKIKTITSVQSKVYNKKILSYKADKLIACGQNIKEHLIKKFNVNGSRISVIFNSVDQVDIQFQNDKETLKNKINISNQLKIIGFAGRLNFNEKGIDILLKAFKYASKYRNDMYLLIVGEGIDKTEIEKFISNEKIQAKLIYAQENIFDYLNIFDVIVLPSRIDPFPLIMLESGYMKKPFIGSKVDGIAELIEHEKDGLLFESENVKQLTNCILRIINDSEFTKCISENLYKKVNENFLASRMVELYQQEYKKLLGQNVV